MVPVVIYGPAPPGGSPLCASLLRALAQSGGALYLGGRRAELYPPERDSFEFAVLESARPLELRLPAGIVVLRGEFENPAGFSQLSVPPGFTAVVESGSAGALTLLRRCGATVITCGMASSDTMSLSSVAEQSGAVSLLREIRTLAGETVEARDIPVSYRAGSAEYDVLAACAVLLLAGRNPEHGYAL